MKAVERGTIPRRVRRHGGFLWRDMCARYPAVLRMSASGIRQVSASTQRARRVFLRAALRRLCELGFFPPTIDALKPKHIAALCRDMEDRGLKPTTIATDVSKLAVLCQSIGKPQLVRDIEGYFNNPLSRHRSGVTRTDKSLEGAGLEFPELYKRAFDIDPRVACMLELCHSLGLRAQESWLFRPHIALQQNMICVFWGTKGGRKRQLPFAPTDEHRKLIEKAAGFVATPAESMLPRGVSMKKWKAHWQRVMIKLGHDAQPARRHAALAPTFDAMRLLPPGQRP